MCPRTLLRLIVALTLSCAIAAFSPWARAATTPDAEEAQIKAALLYKFCLYVTWPDNAFVSSDSPLTLGVVGSPEVARHLAQVIEGRQINGRPVTVRLIDEHTAEPVQLLFIARAEQPRIKHWLEVADGQALLVVTESPDALDNGGIINFALQEQRVKFDINLATAERQGLRMSAQLLKVARSVAGVPAR